jgi:hypothetical protein
MRQHLSTSALLSSERKKKICSHEQLQFAICVLILQLSDANQVVQSLECIFRKAFTGAPAQPKNLSKKKKLLQNNNLGPVHLAYNPSYSACFFSRNSIFLSHEFKNSVATSRPRVKWTASRIQLPLAGHECLLTASARWSPCRYPGVHVSRMMWVRIYVPTYSVCIYQPKVKETNSRPCLCLCMSTYLHKLHDEIYELVLMHVLTMVVCY